MSRQATLLIRGFLFATVFLAGFFYLLPQAPIVHSPEPPHSLHVPQQEAAPRKPVLPVKPPILPAPTSVSKEVVPSEYSRDRPENIRALFRDEKDSLDVTPVIRKLHLGRRLRISKEINLYPLFGDARGSSLDITYMYRGLNASLSATVITKGEGLMFLQSDVVIPDTLVEEDMPERYQGSAIVLEKLTGKSGLEIGGVSDPFRNVVPIYNVIESLDNSNFAATTLWETSLQDGQKTFKWNPAKDPGIQYVMDVTDMSKLRDAGKFYDFVAACHMLEHIANPLRAVKEMVSVLKPDGYLFLLVPYKKACFDHFRDYTPMSDLLSHWDRHTREEDLSEHFEEIMLLHDLSMDPPAGSLAHFRSRSLRNKDVRGLHQHVFSYELLEQVCQWAGLKTVTQDRTGLHMFALCQKSS